MIPVAVYLPYLVFMLRKVGQATDRQKVIRASMIVIGTIPFVELASKYSRDYLYWPLVRDIYIEVKEY